MRRRLDLAGALVARPPVLFLDEPTTGLDPRSRTDMWDVIAELVAGGTTLLLTTQYLEEADRLADSIVVIDHGKVIARGTADELKAQVGGERVEVVGRRAGAHPRRRARAGRPGRRHADRRRAHPQDRRAGAGRPAGRADPRSRRCASSTPTGIDVHDVGLRRPTLDDVFLTLTGHAAEETERRRRRAGPIGDEHRQALEPDRAMRDERQSLGDGAVVAKRNLIKIKRVPDLLVFSTLSPIMFVLLFALRVRRRDPDADGVNYREFLMAGIFAQTVIFGVDLHRLRPRRGHAEGHHRPVPVAADVASRRAGRPHDLGRRGQQRHRPDRDGADRPDRGLADPHVVRRGARGFLLLLLFAYAISWIMAVVGPDRARRPEVVNNAAFIVIFPLTFIANTFVPTTTSRPVLKTIAEWNPVSSVTQAARELFGNTGAQPRSARRVVAAAPGALHRCIWALGDPRGVRAAGGPPVQRAAAAERRRRERRPQAHGAAGAVRRLGRSAGEGLGPTGSSREIFLPFGAVYDALSPDLLADDGRAERRLLGVDLEVGSPATSREPSRKRHARRRPSRR